jgi:hypothetical protein
MSKSQLEIPYLLSERKLRGWLSQPEANESAIGIDCCSFGSDVVPHLFR